MPIKFPQLLQESWNFLRNQRSFTLFGLASLIFLQIINLLLLPRVALSADTQTLESNAILSGFIPTLLIGGLNIFITIMIILNINSINEGRYFHFFQNIGQSVQKLIPVIFLNLIMAMPLSLGMSATLIGASVVALPLLITGLYVFIKFCLGTYLYLVESPRTVSEAVKQTWQLSRGKMLFLIQFCLLAYLFPQLINFLVSRGDNVITLAISMFVSAALSLFVTVFSYRFYQVYRQQGK